LACLPFTDVFDSIAFHVDALAVLDDVEPLLHPAGSEAMPAAATVRGMRALLQDPATGPLVRDAVWRTVVSNARAVGQPWPLLAVWLTTPGLRAAAYRLHRRAPADLRDAQSEVLLGFLEALNTVELGSVDIGITLWRQANRCTSKALRQTRRSVAVENIELATPPKIDHDRTSSPARQHHRRIHAASEHTDRQRLEGERLGAVADRMGLRYRLCVRQPGALIGVLRVTPAQGTRTLGRSATRCSTSRPGPSPAADHSDGVAG